VRLYPKKSLSQHFLKSHQVRERIVEAIRPAADEVILEIGAGTGELTAALASRARRVIAVEVDPALAGILKEELAGFPNARVLCADVLEVDISKVASEAGCGRLLVAGNLPYHITTDILLHLLRHAASISRAVLTVQREYADRLAAKPGGRDYGAVTVRVNYAASVSVLFAVPASAFVPRPKVDSAVVELKFREKPAVSTLDEEALFEVVRAAFSKRRKMLVNSLSSLWGISREELREICRSLGLEAERRPETLSLEEFARLTDAILERVRK